MARSSRWRLAATATSALSLIGGGLWPATSAPAAATERLGSLAMQHGGDHTPYGSLDAVSVGLDSVTFSGWAIDPDTSLGIAVHLYVGDRAIATHAAVPRPDVGAAFPGSGDAHGFVDTVEAAPGTHTACAYAMNEGPGAIRLLGCVEVEVGNQDPIGNVDVVTDVDGTLLVQGWALDPDTGSTYVHVEIDGRAYVGTATVPRPDVEAAYPGYGTLNGFQVAVPLVRGSHTVCVRAVNFRPDSSVGSPVLLGCRVVQAGSRPPIGSLDVVANVGGGVAVYGWAFDPDSTDPIEVEIEVDGVAHSVVADAPRPDVQAAYPGQGQHGFVDHTAFSIESPLRPRWHTVCVTAHSAGLSQDLGCREVVVGAAEPTGSIDVVADVGGAIRVAGWALDPDTVAPTDVHVYVDGVGRALIAAEPRPDVEAAYPRQGSHHGFDGSLPVSAGRHQVCVHAMDHTGRGQSTWLGCRTVDVATEGGSFDPGEAPVGNLEVLGRSAQDMNYIELEGWAFDPDTDRSIQIHVYVDGTRTLMTTADLARPDVQAAHPGQGLRHGFSARILRSFVAPGVSRGAPDVCVYAVDTGWGSSTLLGCREVVFNDAQL